MAITLSYPLLLLFYAACSLASSTLPAHKSTLVSSQSQVLSVPQDIQVPVFFPPDLPAAESSPMIMAYYPSWAGEQLPPEDIDFNKLDWIDFAFAVPTPEYTLAWDDASAPALLSRLVTAANPYPTKIKLSVGGWTGSRYFSSAVATPTSRQSFVKSLVSVFNEFDLDGIDIDWEYPGRDGDSGNQVDPNDSASFLLFLQLLKEALPSYARLSAAAAPVPFAGPDGEPLSDVSSFASILDWVLIMNYDTWSASSNPGPNAPLYDACSNSSQPESSALAAFDSWTSAGFPPSQLVLGLPAYGYVSRSSQSSIRTRMDNNIKVSHEGSQALFRDLVNEGALTMEASHPAGFIGSGGFFREWDDCSSTPFLRSQAAEQVVTYDDPESLMMKTRFAKQVGMLGVNVFSIDGDTADWHLMEAIRREMGV